MKKFLFFAALAVAISFTSSVALAYYTSVAYYKHWHIPSPPKLPVPTYRYVEFAYGIPFDEWMNGFPVAYWRTSDYEMEDAAWGVVRVPISAKAGPCVIIPMGATVTGTNVARLYEGFFTCEQSSR